MKVSGYCPMGCGQTLEVWYGHIACSWQGCPRPDAVSTLLKDRETEHIAEFDGKGFSLQHPLRERLGGDLFGCDMHARLRALDEMPVEEPGVYRVLDPGDGLIFERLEL